MRLTFPSPLTTCSHVFPCHPSYTKGMCASRLRLPNDVRGAAHPLARARVLLAASDDGRRWWRLFRFCVETLQRLVWCMPQCVALERMLPGCCVIMT